MANLGSYIFDSQSNEVHKQANLFPWDEFFRSEERNWFQTSRSENTVVVSATDGELLTLHNVTEEQIVILFATVRGLRDAARE